MPRQSWIPRSPSSVTGKRQVPIKMSVHGVTHFAAYILELSRNTVE